MSLDSESHAPAVGRSVPRADGPAKVAPLLVQVEVICTVEPGVNGTTLPKVKSTVPPPGGVTLVLLPPLMEGSGG